MSEPSEYTGRIPGGCDKCGAETPEGDLCEECEEKLEEDGTTGVVENAMAEIEEEFDV